MIASVAQGYREQMIFGAQLGGYLAFLKAVHKRNYHRIHHLGLAGLSNISLALIF